jgi:hypothetical protein
MIKTIFCCLREHAFCSCIAGPCDVQTRIHPLNVAENESIVDDYYS